MRKQKESVFHILFCTNRIKRQTVGTSVLQRHIGEKDGGLDGTIFRAPSNPDIVW